MLLRALPGLLLTLPATAQSFDFVVDQAQSSSSVYADLETTLPGSVIGVYDATTNPGGTRTANGLFGGSGNEVVPMTTVVDNLASFGGGPTGSFGMDLDIPGFSMGIDDLDMDLLGGSAGSMSVDITLIFSTFRTYNPDSLYVGGIPLTIPLGNVNVTAATAQQTGASTAGALWPGTRPNDYDFTATVPVLFSLTADFNGSPISVPPFNLMMPVTGTITLTGTGATISAGFSFADQSFVNDPFPGFQIIDQPVDVPTILPPGFTANLLLNATVGSIDTDIQIDINVVADGTPDCGFTAYCDANLNSTGLPATIAVTGSADVADKDLTFDVGSLPANQFGYFLMSQTQGFIPFFGGSDGNLCLGAPMLRFSKNVLNSGAPGTMTFSPDFDDLPQGTLFTAGSTWNFQLWHRDKGGKSNTTAGISVLFCN
jgi:hypothetical protein